MATTIVRTDDEVAAALRRDARAHKQALASAISTTHAGCARVVPDVFDADIVAARASLRAGYVGLLLSCPFTRAAQNVDTMIWSDTSYRMISWMRTYLAAQDKDADAAPTSKRDAPKAERRSHKRAEVRRVQDDLLHFLSDEVTFYEQLAARLVRMWALDELAPLMERLGWADAAPEAPTAPQLELARVPAHRHQLVVTMQRLVTFVGDLQRYRELVRGTTDFRDAVSYYHDAHLLLPDHGHPANQLAVVAMCVGDTFGAVYQYYRALCVRVPFDKARHNLQRLLDKSLTHWATSARRDEVLVAWRQAALEDSPAHRVPVPSISASWPSVAAWWASVVEWHALCYLRVDLDAAWVLNEALLRHLLTLTAANELRAADHLRLLLTGACASWLARLHRESPTQRVAFTVGTPYAAALAPEALDEHVRHAWEALLITHVVGVLAALMAVHRHELVDALRAPAPAGLRPVSAVLQRTLPALRLGFKWVKGHLEYMAASRGHAQVAAPTLQDVLDADGSASHLATDAVARLACVLRGVDARLHAFWAALLDFANLLRAAYPFDQLPSASDVDDTGRVCVQVGEDRDVRGLGPLRRTIQHGDESQYALPAQSAPLEGADADYARMADVLVDIKVMTESPVSGIAFDDARSVFVARDTTWADVDDPLALAMQALHARAPPTSEAHALWDAPDAGAGGAARAAAGDAATASATAAAATAWPSSAWPGTSIWGVGAAWPPS